jgi:hypothetical protein
MPGLDRHLKDVFKDVARNSQQRGPLPSGGTYA